MSNIDHILLFSILFFVFYCTTNLKQKVINKHFWKIALIPIILYSIILGCRYGWGNDYPWYKYRFEHPYGYEEEDFGFRLLNLFIHELGCNYVGAFIIYSLIFIVGACILIKGYKENKYMLALFLPATLIFSTFAIRQAIAHAFVFIGLYFLHKKKWYSFIFFTLITYSIHPSAIITLLICTCIYFLFNKPLKYEVTIPIYIIATLFSNYFNEQITYIISNLIPFISFDNKFQSYIDQSDYWFSSDAINEEWKQGPITLIISMCFHIAIIYTGYISLKYRPNTKVIYLYNSTILGFIIFRLTFYFEILRRIANPFVLLYFIPLGYSLYIFSHDWRLYKKREIYLCKICHICIISYLILYFGRFILQSPNYIFYWEK